MSAISKVSLSIDALIESTIDMGINRKLLNFLKAYDFASGTGDSTYDTAWWDAGSLAATTKTYALDALTDNFTASFAEVGVLAIWNKGTAAGHVLTLGNATNPAYVGMFGTSTHTFKVPPGLWLWNSLYDGGGLTVTPTTGMNLKLDSGANSVDYQIIALGRSA